MIQGTKTSLLLNAKRAAQYNESSQDNRHLVYMYVANMTPKIQYSFQIAKKTLGVYSDTIRESLPLNPFRFQSSQSIPFHFP